MTFDIEIENSAVGDIQQAYDWYQDSEQTALRFQSELEQLLERLKSDLVDYREISPGVKTAPLPHFPYNIYYRRLLDKTLVQVIAFCIQSEILTLCQKDSPPRNFAALTIVF